jgi:rare lipoprotein A
MFSMISYCFKTLVLPCSAKKYSFLKASLAVLVSMGVANCSSSTYNYKTSAKGEASERKYGVASSPRLVAEGKDVPKGGGRQMTGKPYTIAGKRYTPYDKPVGYTFAGRASWYGADFHGRKTANGEIFDRQSMTAAHPTMPLPSYVRVTNVANNRSVIVRVNDRGPYHGGRVMDVSQKVAEVLDFKRAGTAHIKAEYLGTASLRGSDDRKLLATLRTDGSPAPFAGAQTIAYAPQNNAGEQSMIAPISVASTLIQAKSIAIPSVQIATLMPAARPLSLTDNQNKKTAHSAIQTAQLPASLVDKPVFSEGVLVKTEKPLPVEEELDLAIAPQ